VVIVTNTFGFYYLLLSYDGTTTCKSIIIELMKKGFIESEFHYFGLFVPGNTLPDSSPRNVSPYLSQMESEFLIRNLNPRAGVRSMN
jgi:hypothetical protein